MKKFNPFKNKVATAVVRSRVIAFLLLLFFYQANAQSWQTTDSLKTARWFHASVTLKNGKVLVTGGTPRNSNQTFSSCEIYDPSSGVWKSTGSMNTPRKSHAITLLANGKVLVIGGLNQSTYLKTCEIFDPSTETWSNTGSLGIARAFFAFCTLSNGNVLVAGGSSSGSPATCELFNPSTGTWSSTGSLNNQRFLAKAVLLNNGNVLITGGTNTGDLTSCEIYNSSNGSWSNTGSLKLARSFHTVTLLSNGKVLVTGGHSGIYSDSCEIYDPSTGKWKRTNPMAVFRIRHEALLLKNGKVLVTGGTDEAHNILNSCELFDPTSGTWSNTCSMFIARSDHNMVLLSNDSALVISGQGVQGTLPKSTELYGLFPGPDIPSLTASSTFNCGSKNTTLSISSGNLNSAFAWKWYSGSCGGSLVGTGNSINVAPSVTTTYYVRGEGKCISSGNCATITIQVSKPASTPTISAYQNSICKNQYTTLKIDSGILNQSTKWQWYSESCGGTKLDSGLTISVNPSSTTTYFVRGEGSCSSTIGQCAYLTISVLPSIYYRDYDNDGFGNGSMVSSVCPALSGYVALSGDCNDSNANINPSVVEILGNNIDDNCNGLVDEFCSPEISQAPCYMYISNISSSNGISNFNKTSGCSSVSYSNFSDSNGVTQFSDSLVNLSFQSYGYPLAYAVWVDYNDNNEFDSTEKVLANDNIGGIYTLSSSFKVKNNAITGPHKLRVRAEYYYFKAPTDPCSQLYYGETEDYTLYVQTKCKNTSIPTLGISKNNICSNEKTSIFIKSGNLNSAVKWAWYSGSCGGVFIGTGDSLKIAPTVSTIYFARGEGGCVTSGVCDSIFIFVKQPSTPSVPSVSANLTSLCGNQNAVMNITSGNLGDAINWHWYLTSCGGTPIGVGTSISVSPNVTSTYYVRAEGGCINLGSCANITISVSGVGNPNGTNTVIGDFTISTQTQMDDFFSKVSGNNFGKKFTKIIGSLRIDGDNNSDPITNLCNLSSLTEITKNLEIINFNKNSNPTDLNQLSNIRIIGCGLLITSCKQLQNISLPNLTNIGCNLKLMNNDFLQIISLPLLQGIKGELLIVKNNKRLESLKISESASSFSFIGKGSSVEISDNGGSANSNLKMNLCKITNINGALIFNNNDNAGVNNFDSIFSGLKNLSTSWGKLVITNNDYLKTCCIAASVNVGGTGKRHIISGNAGNCVDSVKVFNNCGVFHKKTDFMSKYSSGDFDLNIFPNPSNGSFELDVQSSEVGVLSITVFDLMGRVILKEQNNLHPNLRIPINLSYVGAGQYILRAEFNGQQFNKRILISK